MYARLFSWFCRILLGGLFLYAGYTKLRNLALFELTIDTYQILPVWGVIVAAKLLPWLEVALGMALLVGWRLRYWATFTAVLLGAFIAAMAITYFRGIEADCGCFGLGEPISPLTLGRDSALLALAVYLAVVSWRARPAAIPQTG